MIRHANILYGLWISWTNVYEHSVVIFAFISIACLFACLPFFLSFFPSLPLSSRKPASVPRNRRTPEMFPAAWSRASAEGKSTSLKLWAVQAPRLPQHLPQSRAPPPGVQPIKPSTYPAASVTLRVHVSVSPPLTGLFWIFSNLTSFPPISILPN